MRKKPLSEAGVNVIVLVNFRATVLFARVFPEDFVGVVFSVVVDDGFDHVFAVVKLDLIEHIVDGGVSLSDALQSAAVEGDFRGAHIGINRDGSDFALAVGVATLCEIYHRLFTPVGLVPIEGILACFSVEGSEALHVSGRYTTSIGHGSSKVEGVPEVGRQDIRMFGDDTPMIFVYFGLERLRIVLLPPLERFAEKLSLVLDVGVGTIFRQHEELVGVVLLQSFDPCVDILDLLLVPAVISVHGLNVRIEIDGMFHVTITIN